MENKEYITIRHQDGNVEDVLVVTYLVSDDSLRNYLVYSKGEEQGLDNDQVIYISKIIENRELLYLEEIKEDAEWKDVQHLLKKIANV
jgi:uncharacterized protein YrzB (UPF0473 family)